MFFTVLTAIIFVMAIFASVVCNILLCSFDDGTDTYFDHIMNISILWGGIFPCLFGSIAIWAASTLNIFAVPFEVYAIGLISFIGVTGLVIAIVMHAVACYKYRHMLAY